MQRVITCRQILGAIFAASVAVMTLLVAVSGAPGTHPWSAERIGGIAQAGSSMYIRWANCSQSTRSTWAAMFGTNLTRYVAWPHLRIQTPAFGIERSRSLSMLSGLSQEWPCFRISTAMISAGFSSLAWAAGSTHGPALPSAALRTEAILNHSAAANRAILAAPRFSYRA